MSSQLPFGACTDLDWFGSEGNPVRDEYEGTADGYLKINEVRTCITRMTAVLVRVLVHGYLKME